MDRSLLSGSIPLVGQTSAHLLHLMQSERNSSSLVMPGGLTFLLRSRLVRVRVAVDAMRKAIDQRKARRFTID